MKKENDGRKLSDAQEERCFKTAWGVVNRTAGEELMFSSSDEALEHLADVTSSRVVVANLDGPVTAEEDQRAETLPRLKRMHQVAKDFRIKVEILAQEYLYKMKEDEKDTGASARQLLRNEGLDALDNVL